MSLRRRCDRTWSQRDYRCRQAMGGEKDDATAGTWLGGSNRMKVVHTAREDGNSKNGNAAVGYGRESLLELRKRKREQQGPASSGVRRGVAAVAGDSWTRGGCSRCGCGRGKKMRRVRLEVTAAAREDGYNLQSHDREEEWATMTQLRAGRQHQRGRRQ
ncbi:hypothetical protein BHM03_00029757 [Ensete ventricosum]|nr:hypothetical protein BHM03_00029757 [Ensete ventricosum]